MKKFLLILSAFSLLTVFFSPPLLAYPDISVKEKYDKIVKTNVFEASVDVQKDVVFYDAIHLANSDLPSQIDLQRSVVKAVKEVNKPPLKLNRIRNDLPLR